MKFPVKPGTKQIPARPSESQRRGLQWWGARVRCRGARDCTEDTKIRNRGACACTEAHASVQRRHASSTCLHWGARLPMRRQEASSSDPYRRTPLRWGARLCSPESCSSSRKFEENGYIFKNLIPELKPTDLQFRSMPKSLQELVKEVPILFQTYTQQ